jgi:hypothetical protein
MIRISGFHFLHRNYRCIATKDWLVQRSRVALFTIIIIYFVHNYHKYFPYSVELIAICNMVFQLAKPLKT